MLLDFLNQIPDARRNQAKQYELRFIIFFSILAILSGAASYREIESFFEIHFGKLKSRFKLKWKKRPAYTTIRNILQGINKNELEKHLEITQKRLKVLKLL
ncbi:MAG: transposase family protein [bacterium]